MKKVGQMRVMNGAYKIVDDCLSFPFEHYIIIIFVSGKEKGNGACGPRLIFNQKSPDS